MLSCINFISCYNRISAGTGKVQKCVPVFIIYLRWISRQFFYTVFSWCLLNYGGGVFAG